MDSAELYARSVIGERLRNFSFKTLVMDARDVREILEWLDSKEFQNTCHTADLNVAQVVEKFHKLIHEGNAINVSFAID